MLRVGYSPAKARGWVTQKIAVDKHILLLLSLEHHHFRGKSINSKLLYMCVIHIYNIPIPRLNQTEIIKSTSKIVIQNLLNEAKAVVTYTSVIQNCYCTENFTYSAQSGY